MLDEVLSIAMAVVTRQYANALFQVRATVGAEKMRVEAVHGLTAYLSWSVLRSVQKFVGWGEVGHWKLPYAFHCRRFDNLVQSRDYPHVVTTVDVGRIGADDMARINSSLLMDAVDLLFQSSSSAVPPGGSAQRGVRRK